MENNQAEDRRLKAEGERQKAKGRVLMILTRHVGREKAIGMGELYEQVYGERWHNRINDTRELRRVITELRYEGSLIGETRSKSGGGYYLARSVSELNSFFDKRKREALKKLDLISKMKKIGLPELMGQMIMNLTAQNEPQTDPPK